jgi:metallophosphoesterase (TIGR03767 family)
VATSISFLRDLGMRAVGYRTHERKREQMTRMRAAVVLGLGLGLLVCASAVLAAPKPPPANTLGKTTVQQRIVPTGSGTFRTLTLGPGEPYVVRQDLAPAGSRRDKNRQSLAYFGALADFQLADEESPARVEFLDPPNGTNLPFDAAWRPWESLEAQIDDAAIRQLNAFVGASPIKAGDGSRRRMDFTLDLGDSADSQQLNETEWVRTLLEGGTLNPNSGINPAGYIHQLCPPVGVPGAAEAAKYTGVQDYNDYVEGTFPSFYDPNNVRGAFAGWPSYPGLMDRSEQAFTAAGVSVPSYVTFGNHDGLVQGNQAANRSFEDVATGCLKPMAPVPNQPDPTSLQSQLTSLTPDNLLAMLASDPQNVALVPPDPKRQYVSKRQYKQVFLSGAQPDGHGFAYIDPAQNAASNGAAGYYAWSPVPGFRFISLDTLSEGGIAGPSADGNIDDPQFQWLSSQLQAADASNQLIVIFSHHAIPSLTSQVPDEAAPPCTINDQHGHDLNPGCDVDPRSSSPIHLGADLEALLHQHPHVIAWVAGHSHVNDITPYPGPNGTGFWSIRTAAEADWPQQNRLLEIMSNGDGTLSIFGTILDHASPATAPTSGTNASGMSLNDLASVGRTLSYNDPQKGASKCTPACGEGSADDRNVELLIRDPRA